MSNRDLTRADPPEAPVLGESRSRVLSVLQSAHGPVGVNEVADQIGLHPNTTRFHLDGLVEAGLAERASEEREAPGRPRTLYTASAGSVHAGRRSYRLLAEILTSYLASETKQPRQAALKAGEAWGHFLSERHVPFSQVDVARATEQLVESLDEIGFAPEAVETGGERQVRLHHCPFREAAEEHREVVCAVHLGLMRGLLDEIDAPIQAERLDSFVEPNLCVTHIGPRTRRRAAQRSAS